MSLASHFICFCFLILIKCYFIHIFTSLLLWQLIIEYTLHNVCWHVFCFFLTNFKISHIFLGMFDKIYSLHKTDKHDFIHQLSRTLQDWLCQTKTRHRRDFFPTFILPLTHTQMWLQLFTRLPRTPRHPGWSGSIAARTSPCQRPPPSASRGGCSSSGTSLSGTSDTCGRTLTIRTVSRKVLWFLWHFSFYLLENCFSDVTLILFFMRPTWTMSPRFPVFPFTLIFSLRKVSYWIEHSNALGKRTLVNLELGKGALVHRLGQLLAKTTKFTL